MAKSCNVIFINTLYKPPSGSFSYPRNYNNNRYEIGIWYNCRDIFNKKLFAKKIDEHLKTLNDDYATERTAALKDVQVKILPSEIFFKWFEQKNKLGGQNKFPRVLKGKQLQEWTDFISK